MMLLCVGIDDADPRLQPFRDRGIQIYHTDVYPLFYSNFWPKTVYSKYDLFKSFFKRWDFIFFVDGDTYFTSPVGDIFVPGMMSAVNAGSTVRTIKTHFSVMPQEYETCADESAFNAGVLVLDTKLIKEDDQTFNEMLEVTKKHHESTILAEQALMNLYWHPYHELPRVYNVYVGFLMRSRGVTKEQINGIILHLQNPSNIYCSDLVTEAQAWFELMLHLPPNKRASWTKEQVDQYSQQLEEWDLFKHVSIRNGDTMRSLFGKQWRKIYDLPENELFRQLFPDPSRIEPFSAIFCPEDIVKERNLWSQYL